VVVEVAARAGLLVDGVVVVPLEVVVVLAEEVAADALLLGIRLMLSNLLPAWM